jgi:hypothetical protein
MKLHLGCGEHYLKGYINIDFPASKHTVQKLSQADRFIDILKLKYPSGSIEEIRLHHIFEHFPRTVTCALLTIWHSWLKKGGILRIEVPDFSKMALKIINPFSSKLIKGIAGRHIFGSQEAPWATHFSGYTVRNIKDLLERYGFNINKITKTTWKNTANIEVFAVRNSLNIKAGDFEKITRKYLTQFLIDSSASEKRLLEVWMKIYKNQVKKSLR